MGLSIFLIALIGLPPTAGFLGKWYIINASVSVGLTLAVVSIVVNSVISFAYYFSIVRLMFFAPAGRAARVPLGIVTGRPREDAENFLRRRGIGDLFSVLVCLEDGPGKPDPAPVNLALRILEVERAWMVGDTVNDIAAARAASVLPLGVVPPGESLPDYPLYLTAAGAGRVLTSLGVLEEVLPR